MIPTRVGDLDLLVEEACRQSAEVAELFAAPSPADLSWRPDAVSWSVAGHVAHLALVNGPYLHAMEERLRASRASGRAPSDGPYRHPWLARWMVRAMEPPPKKRVKTMRSMAPDPDPDPEEARSRFLAEQERLRHLLDDARGADLGRIRFGSPFMPLLRLSLGAGLELLLAHNRRHLWLIAEVRTKADAARHRGRRPG